MREIVRNSWERSKKYMLPPDELKVPSVSKEELTQRMQSIEQVLTIVDDSIKPLQKVLDGHDYNLGFLDTAGVLLRVYQVSSQVPETEFSPGKIWSERAVGTTAVGVALSTERIAIVDKDEHYAESLKGLIGIAQPIIVYDNMIGVLVLAVSQREGLDYLVNLISLLIQRIEEKLILMNFFLEEPKESKSLEEVFRTFIHEIKNPLTNIRAFFQLQQLKHGDLNEYNKMIQEVDRIYEMIENFRYFSISKNYSSTRINLADLLQNLCATMKSMFNLKGCQLNLILKDECYVLGSENKLRQVFVNIIKNGYEAIVDQNDGRVEVILQPMDDHCYIKVIDNGIGISPREQEMIFKPFYTTKSSGYGLGLTVCSEIISHHRGSIQLESEKSQGTQVTITLPVYNG